MLSFKQTTVLELKLPRNPLDMSFRPGKAIAVILCLLAVTFLAPRFTVEREALLWRIEGEKPSYLFGTIHIPDERVLALPDSVARALASADAVYLELPMGAAEAARMQQGVLLPAGQTLRDLLPRDLFEKVEKLIQSKGLPVAAFEQMKIWALVSTITLLDYLHTARPPLDLFIYQEAVRQGKEVGGLETVEEQVELFDKFSQPEQIEFLRTTIEEMEKPGEGPLERLVRLYLAGDVTELSLEINRQLTRDEALSGKLYRLLLTERDQRMAERIEAKLKENPKRSYFFAVGAAHLSEESSVPVRLLRKGFKVERIKTSPGMGGALLIRPSRFARASPAENSEASPLLLEAPEKLDCDSPDGIGAHISKSP